jgi:MerR family transcriptional regulator/heat shock protein HspR
MAKEYWTVTEVMEIFQVDETVISYLEEGEILCPECFKEKPTKRFSAVELDKLRLAKTLMEDMEVNLPGVEVILRMRESMLRMREQFDDILEGLAMELRKRMVDS